MGEVRQAGGGQRKNPEESHATPALASGAKRKQALPPLSRHLNAAPDKGQRHRKSNPPEQKALALALVPALCAGSCVCASVRRLALRGRVQSCPASKQTDAQKPPRRSVTATPRATTFSLVSFPVVFGRELCSYPDQTGREQRDKATDESGWMYLAPEFLFVGFWKPKTLASCSHQIKALDADGS